jgi:hypothetical protein
MRAMQKEKTIRLNLKKNHPSLWNLVSMTLRNKWKNLGSTELDSNELGS